MTTPSLHQDFLDMLRDLNDAGADFVVVGAHALAVHGIPRATGDLDILVRPTRENARRVVNALQSFGAPIQAHGVTEDDLSTEGTVYQLGLPPRRIDIITACSGVSFEEVWEGRTSTTVGGLTISIIGRVALIKNKLATGRTKDRADVELLAPRDNGEV